MAGDGIEGDDTDGHVDDLTRFVDRTTVVTVVEEDPHDPNHEPLQTNLHRLREMSVEDGTPLRVLTMPMPSKIVREGQRLPASYANFYIGNKVVLMPCFNDPHDAWGGVGLAAGVPGSAHRLDRLQRIDLGPGRFSLPDATTAGGGAGLARTAKRFGTGSAVKRNAMPTTVPYEQQTLDNPNPIARFAHGRDSKNPPRSCWTA